MLGWRPYRRVVIAKLMQNGFNAKDATLIYHHAFAPLHDIAYMRLYADVVMHRFTSHTWQGYSTLLRAYDAIVLAQLQAYMDYEYMPM
jgi:hypothetical protein